MNNVLPLPGGGSPGPSAISWVPGIGCESFCCDKVGGHRHLDLDAGQLLDFGLEIVNQGADSSLGRKMLEKIDRRS